MSTWKSPRRPSGRPGWAADLEDTSFQESLSFLFTFHQFLHLFYQRSLDLFLIIVGSILDYFTTILQHVFEHRFHIDLWWNVDRFSTFNLPRALSIFHKNMFSAKSPFQEMHWFGIRFGFIFSYVCISLGILFSIFPASIFCTEFEPCLNQA